MARFPRNNNPPLPYPPPPNPPPPNLPPNPPLNPPPNPPPPNLPPPNLRLPNPPRLLPILERRDPATNPFTRPSLRSPTPEPRSASENMKQQPSKVNIHRIPFISI
uniref:Uncharacterized protein n=1 Tax=Lepeophtheirus salmonis TaxID=72036 RepID=A0A0K2TJX2_LEPSM